MGLNWQVDETYIKVKGKWVYLYRAIDKKGHTVDLYLLSRRNAKAAKRFLGKALKGLKYWESFQRHQYRQGRFLWGRHHGIKERRSLL